MKTSHPYARKGALHTFTSSRAGGALHAISVPLIAPNAAAGCIFYKKMKNKKGLLPKQQSNFSSKQKVT